MAVISVHAMKNISSGGGRREEKRDDGLDPAGCGKCKCIVISSQTLCLLSFFLLIVVGVVLNPRRFDARWVVVRKRRKQGERE